MHFLKTSSGGVDKPLIERKEGTRDVSSYILKVFQFVTLENAQNICTWTYCMGMR